FGPVLDGIAGSSRYASTSHSERVTSSSRSSRSSDHRRFRRDSPEYDTHEGRIPYLQDRIMINKHHVTSSSRIIKEQKKQEVKEDMGLIP
nr:hypothetical protein [Tanacetum cinerariifolium]GEW52464.1 hypothetical protein [Tanacetum cinerariifolium]